MRVSIKPGVQFSIIAPGGFAILSALKTIAQRVDMTITSGTDGVHSGPTDPHYRGEAYDVRSHDLDDGGKQQVLNDLTQLLGTVKFYFFLENPGQMTEHFHIQVRNGQTYTIGDLLA